MELDDHNTDAAAIAELATLAQDSLPAQVITTADGRVLAIHRDDVQIRDISIPDSVPVPMPKLLKATTQLQTSLAMCQYLHRFKDDDSIMFADVQASKITGIIDYHQRPTANVLMGRDVPAEEPKQGAPATPRHSAHRAVLQLRHSQEWATWVGNNEKLMKHVDFASFLEENALDVISPDGAALLELCRDLQVKAGVSFKSDIRMGDTVSFEYQKADDVSTKGGLELPAMISIAIPVYFGEPAITMNVMLRRKIDDGKLFLGFKIQRLENHKQAEFLRIAHDIETNTEVEMVLGNPA